MILKCFLSLIIFIAAASAITQASFAASDKYSSLTQVGTEHLSLATRAGVRTYTAYVPSTAPPRDAPLVIALHGLGGNGNNIIEMGHWKAAADKHGFIVLAPDGVLEKPDERESFILNPRSWNSGPQTGSWAARNNIDDTGFLRTLIITWTKSGRVAPGEVYVTGFSNGAGMTFRAGADLSDLVAAIAPVSNGLLLSVDHLVRPTSLLMIWGESDPLNPIEGGQVKRSGEQIARPSGQSSFEDWSKLLGCEDAAVRQSPVPNVTLLAYRKCRGGSESLFYRIAGMGHQWPGGKNYLKIVSGPGSEALDATETIWDFFERHKRLDIQK